MPVHIIPSSQLTDQQEQIGETVFKILAFVGAIFTDETVQELFDVVTGDLRRERREMALAGIARWNVRLSLLWGAVRSVLPVVFYGLLGLAKKLWAAIGLTHPK